jgi:hypothetical protein
MTQAGIIFAGLVSVVVVLGAGQILGPRCWKYRLTDDSIECVMFGMRVWRSSFKDVADIGPISFVRLFTVIALSRADRPFFSRGVLVRLRRGVFRAVVITPDQPDDFVRTVREKIGIAPEPTDFARMAENGDGAGLHP